jgi:nucleotide-binding universal stress UspA family protein
MVKPYQSYHKELHLTEAPSPRERILVAVDRSVESSKAARYAIMLAKMSKAAVICLHYIRNIPYVEYEVPPTVTAQYTETAKRIAEVAQQDVKVTGETILAESSVAESIVNYANERKVDIIVIGTKGRTGWKKVLLGSVAKGVMTHAGCPVLVVR